MVDRPHVVGSHHVLDLPRVGAVDELSETSSRRQVFHRRHADVEARSPCPPRRCWRSCGTSSEPICPSAPVTRMVFIGVVTVLLAVGSPAILAAAARRGKAPGVGSSQSSHKPTGGSAMKSAHRLAAAAALLLAGCLAGAAHAAPAAAPCCQRRHLSRRRTPYRSNRTACCTTSVSRAARSCRSCGCTTTLGSPARDAGGMVRNAVLILHSTIGSGSRASSPSSLRPAGFSGARPAPRRSAATTLILPDGIGSEKIQPPERGAPHAIPRNSPMTTRCAPSTHSSPSASASTTFGWPDRAPPWAACILWVWGYTYPGLHGCSPAAGQPAGRDRRAQPCDPQDDRRFHHRRPRM